MMSAPAFSISERGMGPCGHGHGEGTGVVARFHPQRGVFYHDCRGGGGAGQGHAAQIWLGVWLAACHVGRGYPHPFPESSGEVGVEPVEQRRLPRPCDKHSFIPASARIRSILAAPGIASGRGRELKLADFMA